MLGAPMRVRFAPSPTGALHIGNARTALYNWLLARGQGGAARAADRGHRPRALDARRTSRRSSTRSSGSGSTGTRARSSSPQNAERHAEVVEQLLDGGHAYRSTAGPDEVKAFKERARQPRLPRRGRGRGRRAPARARRGRHRRSTTSSAARRAFENALLDDLVIARADGTPVYHLAVVVDDADAGITHVVRGADHYSNTPKQMLIQQAMGAPTPVYAHLPLLHGPGRQEALQAPRRRVRPGAARRRLPARGGPQLPRAARLGLRRGDDVLHRPRSCSSASASSASRSRPRCSTSRSCAG